MASTKLTNLAMALTADAAGNVAQLTQIQSFSVTVSGNAMTGVFTPSGQVTFRNPSLPNGAPVSAIIAAPLSLTIPAGATLGSTSGQVTRFIWLLIYNGGSPVLAVCNISGGISFDESVLINSAVITSSSNSNVVNYSSASISLSPFRIIGYCDFVQTTAGTYAAAPTTVQGSGGSTPASISGFGSGQVWSAPSRTLGTTYYAPIGRAIFVSVWANSSGAGVLSGYVNGLQIAVNSTTVATTLGIGISFMVPAGASYSVTGSGNITFAGWTEMR